MSSPEEWSTLEPAWSQPYAARLETVAVSTESQVATSAAPPMTTASCNGSCGQQQVDAEVSVFLPALFNVMLNIGAAATPPQVHTAQPVSPPRR